MEDTIIEIIEQENTIKDSSPVTLPMNFITIGDVEHDSVQVYIKQDVYNRIEKFAKEEMSKEVGSILIGDYVEEKNRKTVIISNYIEAKFSDASASTLTFTHETWDFVYKEKDKKYADKTIVGWQHTHPGYGIFLSNYDIFIQENFFNLPWQIAYVVDPIADTRGFFEWKNDKVAKMTGFYVYDEVGREIKISGKAKAAKKNISVSSIILSFLLIVSVMLTISFGMEKNNIMDKLNETLSINAKLDQENKLNINKQISVESNEEKGIRSFKVYTVQKGDCLEKICENHNLDYVKNIGEILKINGMSDENKIYVGQELYLPIQ